MLAANGGKCPLSDWVCSSIIIGNSHGTEISRLANLRPQLLKPEARIATVSQSRRLQELLAEPLNLVLEDDLDCMRFCTRSLHTRIVLD